MRIIFIALGLAAMGGAAAAHEIVHGGHDHEHGAQDCAHVAVKHEGHVDYLHDGHLHMAHGEHVDEHAIAVSADNPAAEAIVARVVEKKHDHGAADDAHPFVQHGDHFDRLHDGELHYHHGDHVDHHGKLAVLTKAL